MSRFCRFKFINQLGNSILQPTIVKAISANLSLVMITERLTIVYHWPADSFFVLHNVCQIFYWSWADTHKWWHRSMNHHLWNLPIQQFLFPLIFAFECDFDQKISLSFDALNSEWAVNCCHDHFSYSRRLSTKISDFKASSSFLLTIGFVPAYNTQFCAECSDDIKMH